MRLTQPESDKLLSLKSFLVSDTDGCRMPYIKKIKRFTPHHSIDLEYVLDLSEDCYLEHHLLVHAPGIKVPSACLPVLPLAFGLEMMAEAAACLAPGHGLIGFRDITASDWIDFEDVSLLPLLIRAKLDAEDPRQMSRTMIVELFKADASFPSMKCKAVFGQQYLVHLHLDFKPMINPRTLPVPVQEIYNDRHLFHGPLLQCISKIHVIADNGIVAEIALLPTDKLFESHANPELLTHPIFMDGVAQLTAALFLERDAQALPIQIGNVEMYQPLPSCSQVLTIYFQITRQSYRNLTADVEIHDCIGNVWMRIKKWKFWIFHHSRIMKRFISQPGTQFVTMALQNIPQEMVGGICQLQDLKDVDLRWLARTILHTDEMSFLLELKNKKLNAKDWLVEILTVKDAARRWLSDNTREQVLHPAQIVMKKVADNTYAIESCPNMETLPVIMVSRGRHHVVAVAHEVGKALDIETLHIPGVN